jgi:hypothetical protein
MTTKLNKGQLNMAKRTADENGKNADDNGKEWLLR